MFTKKFEADLCNDEFLRIETSVGGNVRIYADFDGDDYTIVSPRQARKIGKALKRAAKHAVGDE